jgi:hypothetical protein
VGFAWTKARLWPRTKLFTPCRSETSYKNFVYFSSLAIPVGPYTTVEEILMDPTLDPKRDDSCPQFPFLVRFRLALDAHFEVLDWRSIFDEQNFTAMTGIQRQIEWVRFQCRQLTMSPIRFIFSMGSNGYIRLFPSQRATNEGELSESPSIADLTGSLDEVDINEPTTADDVLPTQIPLDNHSLVTMAEIQQLLNWISARRTDGNCPTSIRCRDNRIEERYFGSHRQATCPRRGGQ